MTDGGLERADALLHDAFLTLSSIQLVDENLSVVGFTIQPAGLLRLGKFRAELRIAGATSYEVFDEANVDQIDVAEMTFSEGVLSIRGKMPVELRVHAARPLVEASISEVPFLTKRIGRWKTPAVHR